MGPRRGKGSAPKAPDYPFLIGDANAMILPITSWDGPILNLLDFGADIRIQSPFGKIQKVDKDLFFEYDDQKSHANDPRAHNIVRCIQDVVGYEYHWLLELYLHYVHPNYPILNWHWFHSRVTSTSERQRICPALLAAVYLAALQWWDHAKMPVEVARPDEQGLLRLALDALSSRCTFQLKNICTIQAKLLMCLVPRHSSVKEPSQMVGLAQSIGLNRVHSAWQVPRDECILRKRVAWAVYMHDKWGAWKDGRASLVKRNDWLVTRLEQEDFEDCNALCNDAVVNHRTGLTAPSKKDLQSHWLLFQLHVDLSIILDEALDVFYPLQPSSQSTAPTAATYHSAKQHVDALQMKMNEIRERAPPLPSIQEMMASNSVHTIASLLLTIHVVDMQLHRYLIQIMTEASSLTDQSLPACFLDEHKIYHKVRNEAQAKLMTALEFVTRLSPVAHLRQSFWYPNAAWAFETVASFTFYLLSTSPTSEEAFFFENRFAEMRWTLHHNNRVSSIFNDAVLMVEKLAAIIPTLKEKPCSANVSNMIARRQRTTSLKKDEAEQPAHINDFVVPPYDPHVLKHRALKKANGANEAADGDRFMTTDQVNGHGAETSVLG